MRLPDGDPSRLEAGPCTPLLIRTDADRRRVVRMSSRSRLTRYARVRATLADGAQITP